MKTKSIIWQISSFIFTGIFGVLMHFLFDLSNQSIFIAPFSSVNESIWEHTKLLFFPMLIFSLIQYSYIGKTHKNFWCIKLISVALGITLIPVLYYTINGIFGKTCDWINIAIFFIAVAFCCFLETRLYIKNMFSCNNPNVAFTILILISIIFVLFTFFTPQIPLFQDPITKTYGYEC